MVVGIVILVIVVALIVTVVIRARRKKNLDDYLATVAAQQQTKKDMDAGSRDKLAHDPEAQQYLNNNPNSPRIDRFDGRL